MGSACSKDTNSEPLFEQPDPLDFIVLNIEKDFPLKYFGVCTVFENKYNLLSEIQLLDFVNILNNLMNNNILRENYYSQRSNANIAQNYNSPNTNGVLLNKIKFTAMENILTSEDFTIELLQRKIITSPVYRSITDNDSSDKNDTFTAFMSKSYDYIHSLIKKTQKKCELGLPKYAISVFGLHYCQSKISQKINIILNIISGPDGKITIENPAKDNNMKEGLNKVKIPNSAKVAKNFLFMYVVSAILPTLYYLMEKLAKFSVEKMEKLVGEKGNDILKKRFTDNRLADNEFNPLISIDFGTDSKNLIVIRSELNNFVTTSVFNTIFGGVNNKKSLTKKEFKDILLDKQEGGGFWLLSKEGIRNKFEYYLEHQNK